MRTATIVAIVFLAALSGWFWFQLRDTWGEFNSVVVVGTDSKLNDARRLEAMIREGRVEEALEHLQIRRDTWVLGLGEVRTAIDNETWRWKRDAYVVNRATKALQDEAAYRRANKSFETGLSDQVADTLEEFD